MHSYSLNEIRKELRDTDADRLRELCLRLARYKKENKELLSYLLFKSHDESSYVDEVKEEMDALFLEVPSGVNSYFIKKTLRRVLRVLNRQIKFSDVDSSELELRCYFLKKFRERKIPRAGGTILGNIYEQQKSRILSVLKRLPEDLQADYESEIKSL